MPIVVPVGTGVTAGSGISTYAGLVTTIGEWLNRDDLTSKIPVFIALLEARLNREMRVPDMEVIVELTVDDGATDLPTDFLEAHHLYIDGDTDNEIVPAPLDTFRRQYPTSLAGRPQIYAITAGQFMFAPSPDTTYTAELHYYQKIEALSDDNQTNWLLLAHPDVYLFGALLMAEAFLWNDERLGVWKGVWDEAIDSLKGHSVKKRHGGGPLYPRPSSSAP